MKLTFSSISYRVYSPSGRHLEMRPSSQIFFSGEQEPGVLGYLWKTKITKANPPLFVADGSYLAVREDVTLNTEVTR